MNEVDLILERCSLDIWDGIDEPIWEDGTQFLEDVITEAGHGVSKKNIFQKIWTAIVKIWRWICKQWNRFLGWIKRLFSKKKAKTADQILMGVIPAAAVAAGGAAGIATLNGIKTIDVDIPKSELSDMDIDNKIHLMIKPIRVSFTADKYSIEIKRDDAKDWLANNHGKVRGQSVAAVVDIEDWWGTIIAFTRDPAIMSHFRNIFSAIRRAEDGKIVIPSDINELVTKFNDVFWKTYGQVKNVNTSDTESIPLSRLDDIAKDLNDIMDLLDSFGDISRDSYVIGDSWNYNHTAATMNNLLEYCSKIQFAINAFTRVLQGVYLIDGKFRGSISDLSAMDKFITAMIQNAFPPKYVAYNSFLAASPRLIQGKDADYAPIWGQSRLVVPSPDSNYVYKFALSKVGIFSNRNEWKLSEEFHKYPGADEYIGVTYKIENNGSVTTAESLKTKKDGLPESEVAPIVGAVQKFCLDHHINMIDDLHSRNFGYKKNGKPAILDYGDIKFHIK